jgi:ribosome-associated translation inhibitor RaiA
MTDREVCVEDCDLSDKFRERETAVQEMFEVLDDALDKLRSKISKKKRRGKKS